MSRLHKIDAKKFKELKAALKTGAKRQTVANRNGVSVETLRKVNLAKTFLEYQANNVKAHPTPKPGTIISPTRRQPSNTYTAPQPKATKRGFWARLFNA